MTLREEVVPFHKEEINLTSLEQDRLRANAEAWLPDWKSGCHAMTSLLRAIGSALYG